MKKLIFLGSFLSLCMMGYTQDQYINKNIMIGVYTNVGINQPIRFQKVDFPYEPGKYHGNGSYSAGVKFSKYLSQKYKIELGAVYSTHKVGFEDPEIVSTSGIIYHETFQTFNIPIILKDYLKNNYFLSAGTVIDIGLPRRSLVVDTQTGFGLSFGGGKEFVVGNFILDIAPNLEIHSVIPFSSVAGQQRLMVFGIRLGLNNNCP